MILQILPSHVLPSRTLLVHPRKFPQTLSIANLTTNLSGGIESKACLKSKHKISTSLLSSTNDVISSITSSNCVKQIYFSLNHAGIQYTFHYQQNNLLEHLTTLFTLHTSHVKFTRIRLQPFLEQCYSFNI